MNSAQEPDSAEAAEPMQNAVPESDHDSEETERPHVSVSVAVAALLATISVRYIILLTF